jgi:carboxymethylenebutenolidase
MHDELESLKPVELDPHPGRRTFLITKLTAGFALAVSPATAATITTDTNGLTAGEVKIPVSDGEIPAYRAMPAKGKNFPVVLVIQEIFGVHEHIKDLCRRFAKQGYLAIAPELFSRQGDVSKLPDFQSIIRDVVSKVPDQQVMKDLDSTVAFAAKNKGNIKRLATTGFCWGGRIVWLYAAHSNQLKAGAAWYGRLLGAINPLQPKNPIDVAADLKAPVLGLYAGKDGGIKLDTVDQMKAKLAELKMPSDIVVYPEAQHGFNADYRPSYSEKDSADAWSKMLAFFRSKGV